MSRRRLFFGVLVLHFFLVLTVCCRDTLSVLAKGYTFFPHFLDSSWRKAEVVASSALGQRLDPSNPLREALAAYMHGAGIEAGYGFFAPNVPDSYKLVFEVHYRNGRVEYDLPHVGGTATGLRLASLLDNTARTSYDALRELIVRMLAYSVWQEHPDATMIRAVFGFVNLPSAADFAHGKKESYEFMYAYDFRFHTQPAKSQTR